MIRSEPNVIVRVIGLKVGEILCEEAEEFTTWKVL